jgi:hypothetical protein
VSTDAAHQARRLEADARAHEHAARTHERWARRHERAGLARLAKRSRDAGEREMAIAKVARDTAWVWLRIAERGEAA